MRTTAKGLVALLWMPMLLFAWGPDVTVDTLRVTEDGYPVDYDVVWPTDSIMLITVAINYPNDTAGIRIYETDDQGQTWMIIEEIPLGGYQLKNIQTEYWMDDLYILCTTTNEEFLLLRWFKNKWEPSAKMSFMGDSVTSACMAHTIKNDSLIIYFAITSRYSSYDTLSIARLNAFSAQGTTLNKFAFPNNDYYFTYRDIDVVTRGDTIKVFATLEMEVRITGGRNIHYHVFHENPDGSFAYDFYRGVENGPILDSRYPSCSVAPGGYLLLSFEANGDIYYAYSNDYGDNFTFSSLPFNFADSTESTPVVEWWVLPTLYQGFHLLFSREGVLYIVEAYINSDGSLTWGEPVVVSDVNPYTSYVFRDYMTFLPRLAMAYNVYTPVVVWARDFWHYGGYPNLPIYDSTLLCVDNMLNTRITEGHDHEEFDFSVSLLSAGFVKVKLSDELRETASGEIISVDGRVVKRFNVRQNMSECIVDLRGLPRGVYFVRIFGDNIRDIKSFVLY